MGFVLVSMLYASTYKKLWRRYQVFFVVFMVLLPELSSLAISKIQIQQAAQLNAARTDPNSALNLSQVYPAWSSDFFVPFGFRPNGIGTYLSTRIDYGRFDGLQNMNTVPGVSETIEHMQDHPEQALLLPDHFDDFCQINPFGQRLIISLLFDTVYLHRVAHPTSIRKPICDYIHANYTLAQPPGNQNFTYGLWIRQPAQVRLQQTTLAVR
ncbi:MAG TPA: hypothetical protein VGI45_15950 [Terracidiphilus sp.]|jgi:hypothetical protein